MLPPNFRRLIYKAMKQPGYALKVAARRLAAHGYYRFGNGRSGNPESITLFLTHKCNLHCKMCGQWGEGGVTKKQSTQFICEELPVDTLRSMIDEISDFSPSITLFGGEPLLYKDCIEIIKYIKSKKMHCLVITNGSLIEPLAKQLVESRLDELNVSIDGPRDTHDRIRGLPGLFDGILAGLELVKLIKTARGLSKPLVNIQCTITKDNYLTLDQMADVARRAGADSMTFHNLIFTNKDILARQKKFDGLLACSSADWDGFDFDPGIDPAALSAKVGRIISENPDLKIDLYPNFSGRQLERYYNDPSFIPSEYPARCLSPWIAAYVFPDGEVRPCLNCSYSYGNIKKAPFKKIWNSQNAVKYRLILKENKIFPVCSRCTELYRY